MCGGGGTSTTTQQTTIPPEVLARYNAVNKRAEDLASTPFQKYSTNAEDFVAQLNQGQKQAIQNTGQYANAAQGAYSSAQNQLQDAQSAGAAALSGAYSPLAQGQQQGVSTTNQALQGYQNLPGQFTPAYNQAQGALGTGLAAGQIGVGDARNFALAGSQSVNPQQFSSNAVNQYMSPFLENVVQNTMRAQEQQNAQQRNALRGDAIKSGAFGGDRAGIAQANLAYQQALANNQTISNLYNQGYGQAAQMFQQQQGVNLGAEQANRQALQQTGQQLGNLAQQQYGMGQGAAQTYGSLGGQLANVYGQQAQGLANVGQQQFGQGLAASQQLGNLANQGYQMGSNTAMNTANLGQGAQNAGLQGAQAMMGMGQIAQQTEQAGKTALYNQYLQEKSYPFQVAQFLANIAMGTGSLTGSTTTTTQPSSFFSDERLKDNVEPIGETYDGQAIVRYNYKGSPQTRIGLIAQDVEEHHPEAVGLAAGFKTVDYDAATRAAAEIFHRAQGDDARQHKALGGASSSFDADMIKQLLANQSGMYAGLYGQPGTPHGAQGAPHGGKSMVPAATLPVGKLTSHSTPQRPTSGMDDVKQAMDMGSRVASLYKAGKELYKENFPSKEPPTGNPADKQAPAQQPAAAEPVKPPADKVGLGAADTTPEALQTPASGVAAADIAAPEAATGVLGAGSQVAARGGRIYKGAGGSTSDDDSDPDIGAPEGMYEPVGGGIDIPNESRKNELMKPDKPPKAPDSGFGDILGAASKAASIAASMVAMFSDERVKENIKKVGKLNDGQDVYKYNYKGSPKTQIGLIAQNVEKHVPDAVTSLGDVKMVDYDKATKGAERRKRAAGGTDDELRAGLVPMKGEETVDTTAPENKEGLGAVRLALANPNNTANDATGVVPPEKKEEPNIDELFEKNILRLESRGKHRNPDGSVKVSPKGATGIAQVMPGTAPEAAKMAGLPYDENKYINDEEYNKALGRAYYRAQYQKYGDPVIAAAAYNAGPGAVDKALAKAEKTGRPYTDFLPAETRAYIAGFNETAVTNDVKERRVAAAAVPGVAGPGRGATDAASAPYSSLMKGILPEGTSKKASDILTSENFWVPLLAGVGSMLSSPSIKLPGAIGAGLVGGTSAYTGLKGLQANVANTEANTEATISSILDNSFQTDPNGLTRVKYKNQNGDWDWMPLSEWSRLRRQGKSPKLDPRIERIAIDRGAAEEALDEKLKAAGPGAATTTQPKTPTGAQPQTKTEEGDGAKINPTQTRYTYIDPNMAKEAYKEAQTLSEDTPNAQLGEMKDVFTPQQSIAANAATQKQSLLPFGGSLAALPADNDVLAGGIPQQVLGPLVGTIQGLGNIFGFSVKDPDKIADYEEVKKEVARLRASMAQAGNQSAVSALDRLGEGLPSNLNTKEAQARLYSTLLIANQREIDKNKFYNEWFEAARGADGEFARGANKTGRLATDRFDAKFNQEKYNDDKKKLERIFKSQLDMPDGKSQNLFFVLSQGGQPLPQKVKDLIADKYGADIFRYFNIPYSPSRRRSEAAGSATG